jgi:ribose transport system substrate-binding protein
MNINGPVRPLAKEIDHGLRILKALQLLLGGSSSPLEEQELREGVINALVVQNPFEMGYKGVETAVQKIRENAGVESQNTSVTLVTRDNVDDPRVQSVLHPSCDNPPT